MNKEQLSVLLTDRALGALSPEVAALLEDHLAGNPDAAREAGKREATVRTARRLLADVSALPTAEWTPESVLEFHKIRLRADRRAAALGALRLAASVAVGLGAGLWIGGGALKQRQTADMPLPIASMVGPRLETASSGSVTHFWSVDSIKSGRAGTAPGFAGGAPGAGEGRRGAGAGSAREDAP